jgi:membrane associated rhomboid family serine protease
MNITVIIIIITCIVSFLAFSNQKMINDLIFSPPAVAHQNQWYRFFTCGLIHADIGHLAFNMISLYFFGKYVEEYMAEYIFGPKGELLYALLYISALAASLIPTYSQNKENYAYRSLGASGAVSAVVFAGIFLFPTQDIQLIFLPAVPIRGFIFGAIYLLISAYLGKRGGTNINHSAHIWGALYGIAFLIVTSFALSQFNPLTNFIDQVQAYFQSF